ncbi:BTAD domain-containing putative transcriptional regulator [Actinokineospora terrae]|uniref:Transcriptional regulatory protein, C terminal n=1 Tax=Actinokineospora terrae TaxID=155974 RepID=A0A1H9MM66_9PSEU|nr:BTAD domain-containing putative transcriptional regulator [Actinokineospora terrae]SER24794.1 Transcriptional regulatory protein, C terminal [Actinokineospora terrae]
MTTAPVVGTAHRTPQEARGPGRTAPGRVLVEFRALGPVAATVCAQPVDLGAPKQRALLALLVSQVGQPVPVDVVVETLWAGHPPPSAITSLQSYVANLRRLLEPERAPRAPATVLRTSPWGYLLDGGVVDVDVRRFGEHSAAGWRAWDQGDAERALAEFDAGLLLWRGQAYPEVADAPCVVPEVARLEELRLSVFEIRCAALLAVGAHEVVIAELGAFLKANPWREHGYELLSLALYRAGRQTEALEVLRAIGLRLKEEMGIDPGPALQQRKQEILNQAPALDWQPTTRATVSLVPQPKPDTDKAVFVGREPALAVLTEALAAATAGRGQVVAVTGEPGGGKSALLTRFAARAAVPVLCGTCPEHVAASPLWPWEQVLRAAGTCFTDSPAPGPVAELLGGVAPAPTDDEDASGVALRRFEAIVHYLTDVSRNAPVVVLLDQFHRADPCSLRLLAHLAESVRSLRVLLVVAYRSDEAPVLAETMAALSRGDLTRIDLGGLDIPETRALASAVLCREVCESTAEQLRARTGGNPFFLVELLKPPTGQQVDDPSAVPLPPPAREVALRRVARLPGPAVELLSVAAVAGRCFNVEVVAEVVPVGIDAALESLDAAIAAGLVVEDQHRLGWFRFAHAVVAEALHDNHGRLRRARLRRRLGAVAGSPRRRARDSTSRGR